MKLFVVEYLPRHNNAEWVTLELFLAKADAIAYIKNRKFSYPHCPYRIIKYWIKRKEIINIKD